MKALIIGADAVEPSVIFGNTRLFPNLCKMIKTGAYASYSAYVQKGYGGSYSSEQNWASIYTGLPPEEHGITTHCVRGERRRPRMSDFNGLEPFWELLNQNGYRVGLWAADNCANPVEIDGYCVSAKYDMIETPTENRLSPRELQMCVRDVYMQKYLTGEVPPRLYPKTLKQQGYEYSQMLHSNELAQKVVQEYHFQDALPNFERELAFFFGTMGRAQRENPVDVMFWYTVTTDLIAHCCMCDDNNDVLLEAYRLLDQYIGEFIAEFHPEITVFLSDHGQQNFKDLVRCENREVRREAFAAREEVLWLGNGYMAFEAHNGALLFTAHALKGTFIAAGRGIRHTCAKEVRTLDIYPTLLEMLGIEVPQGRCGYVADIFDRPVKNVGKLLDLAKVKRKSIGFIQTHAVNITDIMLNELYIANRFADITLIGEERYREIFLGNPRVACFIPFEKYDAKLFDKVYCGIYDENSKLMRHMKIFEKG